jgi:hypothetical protein
MNLLNRILVVFSLILIVPISAILIGVLIIAPGLFRTLGEPVLNQLGASTASNATQLVCFGLLVLIFAFAILLLLLEMQRAAPTRLRVQQVAGGDVVVTAEAIAQRLEYAIDQLPEVIKVRPHISAASKGNVVDLYLELETSPDVDVPRKTEEVLMTARQVTEGKMGLKVGKVQVKIDHAKVPPK